MKLNELRDNPGATKSDRRARHQGPEVPLGRGDQRL